MSTTTETCRDPVFDIVKFLMMLFVVAGHLTGNDIVVREIGVSYLNNANIGVAMPLFFMISGYFSKRSYERSSAKILARMIGFIWPLASFGVIFSLILFLRGGISPSKAAIYPITRIFFGSWFLPTLAAIYGVCSIVWRMTQCTKGRVLSLVGLYILLFFAAGQGKFASALHLSSILHMIPYFSFGLLILNDKLYKKWFFAIPCGVLFITSVIFQGDIRTNGMSFYWVPTRWQTVLDDRMLTFCFFARTFVGITGSIFVLWSVGALLRCVPCVSYFAVFGTTTLGVYVMHEWPLNYIHSHADFSPLPTWHKWPLALLVFFIFHYMTVLIRRNKVLRVVFFGDELSLARAIEYIEKNFVNGMSSRAKS